MRCITTCNPFLIFFLTFHPASQATSEPTCPGVVFLCPRSPEKTFAKARTKASRVSSHVTSKISTHRRPYLWTGSYRSETRTGTWVHTSKQKFWTSVTRWDSICCQTYFNSTAETGTSNKVYYPHGSATKLSDRQY
jgi:hypothetical protein